MILALTLLSGICWTVVYIECLRVGVRQRSYAMPAAALALNLAWELLYGVRGLTGEFGAQSVVNVVWAVLDLGIAATYLRFGRADLPAWVTRRLFAAWSLLLLATAAVLQWMFLVEFGAHLGTRYAAFLQNLLMSGLFIAMFVARGGPRGQSVTIAAAKWIGTLAPTISIGFVEGLPLVIAAGLLCSVFDLVYLGMLLVARRAPAPDAAGADGTAGAAAPDGEPAPAAPGAS